MTIFSLLLPSPFHSSSVNRILKNDLYRVGLSRDRTASERSNGLHDYTADFLSDNVASVGGMLDFNNNTLFMLAFVILCIYVAMVFQIMTYFRHRVFSLLCANSLIPH